MGAKQQWKTQKQPVKRPVHTYSWLLKDWRVWTLAVLLLVIIVLSVMSLTSNTVVSKTKNAQQEQQKTGISGILISIAFVVLIILGFIVSSKLIFGSTFKIWRNPFLYTVAIPVVVLRFGFFENMYAAMTEMMSTTQTTTNVTNVTTTSMNEVLQNSAALSGWMSVLMPLFILGFILTIIIKFMHFMERK